MPRRRSASTIISVWFGGTTRSSAPWKKMTGQFEPVGVGQRRALAVERFLLRIGADQPVEIAALEFMRVAGERGDVAETP